MEVPLQLSFLVKCFFSKAAPFVDTIQQSQGAQQTEQIEQRELTLKKKKWANSFQTVFADTEDIWTKIFEENNLGTYEQPKNGFIYWFSWKPLVVEQVQLQDHFIVQATIKYIWI